MTIQDFADSIKSRWNYFAQVATAILSALSPFLLPPPIGASATAVWFRFGEFAVAALVALAFVPMSAWSERRHTVGWWIAAASALIVGTGALFHYQFARDAWTVGYAGDRVVHGSRLASDAARYRDSVFRASGHAPSDSVVLMDSGGEVDSVWDPSDRLEREHALGARYLTALLVLGMAIVFAVQTAFCASRPASASAVEDQRSESAALGGATARTPLVEPNATADQ